VARGLVQQVRQRRVAAAGHGQAGSGRRMGLLARVGRCVERFGDGRRRAPHRGCFLDGDCRRSRLLAARVHCQGDRRGCDQCMAEGLLSHRWLVKHSGSASAFPTGGSGGSVPASSAGLGPPSDGGWQFPQRSPGSPESGAPASADPPSAGGGATTAGYVTKPPSNVALAGTPFTVTAEAPGAYARKSRTGFPVTARRAPSGVVFFEIALWLECIIRLSPLWRIATIN